MTTFIEELQELAAHPHDVAGAQELIRKAVFCLRLAQHLDAGVSEFLDAYRAFNNYECDDILVSDAESEMMRNLYAFRLSLKAPRAELEEKEKRT
jgi:hypothetical protein